MQLNGTIRTIVFDLGKVLVDFDYSIAVRRLAARARMTVEQFAEYITHAPLLLHYESGRLTTDQFFRQICTVTGFCGTVDEFAVAFGDIFSPIQPMIDLHAELQKRGYATYILSNTNELAVRHIRTAFPFFRNFDGYVLSYELGSMKPEPAIYEALEQRAQAAGQEILYLDDRAENVEAAAARGWHIILHEEPEKSRARMHELQVL